MSKILIIDDEKPIRKALREILEYENHKVEEAEDGADGISKIEKGTYDLILCDVKMPKKDGIEVLEKIQSLQLETPVIMISGHGTVETAVEAIQIERF